MTGLGISLDVGVDVTDQWREWGRRDSHSQVLVAVDLGFRQELAQVLDRRHLGTGGVGRKGGDHRHQQDPEFSDHRGGSSRHGRTSRVDWRRSFPASAETGGVFSVKGLGPSINPSETDLDGEANRGKRSFFHPLQEFTLLQDTVGGILIAIGSLFAGP
jgi:hypothetical protein